MRALLLLIIAGLGIEAHGGAAQALPAGRLGETSTGSIGISVSVRPQVQISSVSIPGQPQNFPAVALDSSQGVCLFPGEDSRNFTLMLQSSDIQQSGRSSVALQTDQAATAACRSSAANAAAETASGYRLPTPSRQLVPSMLLIVPE